jgi:glycosyltransferase involved in cell wall biosynthesis
MQPIARYPRCCMGGSAGSCRERSARFVAERPFSILQINTMDGLGGAARVASGLHQAYLARGRQSWLAVGWKGHDETPNVLQVPNDDNRSAWARIWLALGGSPSSLVGPANGIQRARMWLRWIGQPGRLLSVQQGYEDFDFPGTWHLLDLPSQPPMIVHCHNLHGGYFDLRALPWLSTQVPLVATLHDAWMLSGHCAHSLDCERWKTGCGSCPYLEIYPHIPRDKSAQNWRRKQVLYAATSLHVATPCDWLMQKVRHSILAPSVTEARVVPNGVDRSIFRPAEKRAARQLLGVPQDAKVVLSTGVEIWKSMWKDYETLRAAVGAAARRLPAQRVILFVLGGDAPNANIGPVEARFVPYQQDLATVARYYQAADIYLHSAKADTFPSTILEALACGTPVVATAVGGIPEQLKHGETGFLVPAGDPQSMAEATTAILADEGMQMRLGHAAAHDAQRRFDLSTQVNAYLGWYAAIAERWKQQSGAPESRTSK